jgi:3D (Asp-Asp-Asp) domain-containing protein
LNLRKVLLITLLIVMTVSTSVFALTGTVEENQQKASEIQSKIIQIDTEKSTIQEKLITNQGNQQSAHEMAENARKLGLSEDDVVIVRAKQIWQENAKDSEELKLRLQEIERELESLKIEYDKYSAFSNLSYVGNFKLTGYCPCYSCCGKSPSSPGYGVTARGTRATEGFTIAADKRFAFGTKLYIEGLGFRTVEDRGGAIHGNRIDVYYDTHGECFSPACNTTAKVYIVNG